MKLIICSMIGALTIIGCTYFLRGCSERRDVKTEDIVYGIVAQHPNEPLSEYFAQLEGQEVFKWDIGELSAALTRLIRKGRVVTTDKGVKVVESR